MCCAPLISRKNNLRCDVSITYLILIKVGKIHPWVKEINRIKVMKGHVIFKRELIMKMQNI
jgi:hypothetical protein